MSTPTFVERRTAGLLQRSREVRFLGLSDDMVCCIQTEGVSYEIAVADRANCIAAIAEGGRPSDLCMALGAVRSCQSIKMVLGLISQGYHLRFTPPDWESTTTAKILHVTVITDHFRAQTMRELAEARWLPSQEWWRSHQETLQTEHFTKEELPAVDWILRLFSPRGRRYALDLLIAARKISKLHAAIDSLSKHYDKYWIYQDPKLAGMILGDKDAEEWEWVHLEVGVPRGG